MTMKQIAMLLVMLFATFPGYGDTWDDIYQRRFDLIQEALDFSLEEGYARASNFASDCLNFVEGFVLGSAANGNTREYYSKRYTDWQKSRMELSDKTLHFLNTKEYGHATYYAKQEFELNCQYETTLKRETIK